MRAVLLTGHGDIDKLAYRTDVPRPSPGPGEVLVRVRAAAVNNTDVATRQAWYAPKEPGGAAQTQIETFSKRTIEFPRIQGASAAGVIEEVGSGVASGRIGEAVLVDPFIRDLDLPPPAQLSVFLGSGRDGGFADYVAVPAENAVAIDCDLSFAELACLPVAYQTAEEMQARAGLRRGDTVVVTGASGGVGAANVQLARMRGAQVIAVAGEDKRSKVMELGADHVIARGEDLVASTTALCGERRIDVVLDVAGGDQIPALLHCLRRGGHFVTAGAIAGPFAEIDFRVVIYRDLKITGVGTSQPEALAALVRHAEAGALRPSIGAVYPLAELAAAQAEFIAKKHVGKIVIDVADASAPARSHKNR